ncbi:MAG: hypothetical protein JO020_17745 [Chloroflexi bacterium]|nr:hypothetical protein [Chloroflexota bacterium]MBV9133687.1 hypothetical protein [Chloroflexota bacterium]MBV9896008.1 hypothetical protein [Chloroflexota bacterium]
MSMQASGGGPWEPEDFERELRRSLYRFDCPDAQMLGDYQLELLEPEERTRIAAHAVDCDECRDELQTLRAFLAMPTLVADPPFAAVRRFVATLFTPTPGLAFGGLRGAADSSTRVFEAHDVTVSVGRAQTTGSLLGLVVAAGQTPDSLEGHEVRLSPRDGLPLRTQLDDLGNFEFNDVPAGDYALEIDLPDGVLVIEELRVD